MKSESREETLPAGLPPEGKQRSSLKRKEIDSMSSASRRRGGGYLRCLGEALAITLGDPRGRTSRL